MPRPQRRQSRGLEAKPSGEKPALEATCYASRVFVVAICELKTRPEIEAQALARDLGGTAYEHQMHLVGGLPATVLTTIDRELAERTLAAVRRRGHGAVACDASAVVPSEHMVDLRRFRLEHDAVLAEGPRPQRLPASDVLALLRATHRTDMESREQVKGKQLSMGRALVTGGLVMSKSVKNEQRSRTSDVQQVLYIFRASGETPWLLRERGTHFGTLGSAMGPSSMQNFVTTIGRLRELAPAAAYDERLLALRRAPGPPVKSGSFGVESVSTSSASALDLAAHLLALWIRRGAAPQGPR